MKRFKISLLSIVFFLSLISMSTNGFAKVIDDNNIIKTEKLTKTERDFLKNKTGHTDKEIDQLPVEVAKQLVEDKAVIQDSHSELVSFDESINDPGVITPMSTISSSTMKLAGVVYKVTSDKANNDKYYIYGNFTWLNSPEWTLTDKMTFGFPSSAGFYLPTSSGAVTQHQHRYSQDPQGNGNWIDYAIDYSPCDWDPNAGVAGDFDLRTSTDLTLHKGYMGQYVYVPTSASGTMNIKIEYGHQKVILSPTVGVYPAGLAITPAINTDTASYALTLSY
jgi:hypothetical protein